MEQEQQLPEQPAQAVSMKSEAWEWTKALFIAAVLVIIIRWFIFAPFIVDGPSMEPNFHTRERLIVNKIIYNIRTPERGEVVVFHAPTGVDYIKRVVALPGEKIKIQNNKVFINGEELKEPYLQEAVDDYKARTNSNYNVDFSEITVEEGKVFVMGDNRVNSQDSRAIGTVAFDKIVGRADVRFWPLAKLGFIKH
ncbi:signal peptidase I [Paenibacillus mesotrionivorans]|jgi:signal peptidase I|uniref:Signal peptidase I n=1 Tax=Paenibacillus mesotrionivorans TaxID=3160968 RepID=A0ACC7NYL0_9BACL